MTVANGIQQQLENASWIRKMFEEGIRLKAERGAENIFDFTLGKPERGSAPRRAGHIPPAGRGKPAHRPRLHAERRISRRAAGRRTALAAGYGSGVYTKTLF